MRLRLIIGLVGASSILLYAASLLLKEGERRRGIAFLAAWFFPGAGHLVLGKWAKGLFFLALLGGLYLAGLSIVGFRSVDWDENPFYYVGQYGSGLTMLGGRVLFVEKSYPLEWPHLSWYDPGLLYVCCAGLLNLVVMLNLVQVKAAAPAAPPPAAPEKAAP